MYHIGGIGGVGSLMAFGTHIGVPADGVHGRVVMLYAGDGLGPVALAAGEVGPDRMNVPGLVNVAFLATAPLVKSDSPMGIGEPGAGAHLSRRRAIGKETTPHPRYLHHGKHAAGLDLVLFIKAGTNLIFSVTADGGGHLFLGPNRSGERG